MIQKKNGVVIGNHENKSDLFPPNYIHVNTREKIITFPLNIMIEFPIIR